MNKITDKFQELEKQLDINFKDKDLLVTAFVHRSFLNENKEFALDHNERLEFLGDAVLELVVTSYLFYNYPEDNEGTLTSWRAALVNSTILSQKADQLGFEDYLLLSKGEQKETGKSRQFILANTFESFIGAMYLDQGLGICKNFIENRLIKEELEAIIQEKRFLDSKSYFQEKAQEAEKITPVYKLIEEWGPDHDKHFKIGVYLEEQLIATGEGSSKQEAEQEAAKKGLEIKKWK